jgi:hypothetical protein
MLAACLTWACQKFEHKGLLSEDCDTELLRTLQIQNLFFKTMLHRTSLSELCDTGPYCQSSTT